MKINARAMMEGSLLAALTAIMGIFYNIPILNVLTLFWPVPIIIIGFRHGFRVSILSSIVASAVVALITTPITGLILLLTYALPGSLMGLLMRRKVSIYLNLLICGAVLAVAAILETILGLQIAMDKSFIELIGSFGSVINNMYDQAYNELVSMLSTYRKFGIDEETIQLMISYVDDAVAFAKVVIPTLAITTGIAAAFVNFEVVRLILRRTGYYIEGVKRFPEWKLEGKAKAIVLGLTFAVLMLMYFKVKEFYYIYINIFILLMLFYGILGLSITAYLMEKVVIKYEIPRFFLGISLLMTLLLFGMVLPYVGMFDMTANIRRLNKNTIGGVK